MLLVRAALVLALVIIGAVADDGIPPRKKCDVIVLPSDDDPKIIYYQLKSDTNATHFVWGLQDIPSLFMSVTGPNSTCLTAEEFNKTIDWDKFLGDDDNCTDPCEMWPEPCNCTCNYGALSIPGQDGEFAFALTFNSLVEFYDSHSKANKAFNPKNWTMSNLYSNYSLANLKWTFNKDINQLMTSGPGGLTWYINLNVPTEGGRLDYFPKTLYTINSTTFDFIFQNFPYQLHIGNNASRLVLDVTIVHGPLSSGILTSRIPLLLIIFGSIYVAFKKKVWQKCSKTGYTKMTNEKEDEDEIKANGGDKINKE
ncbi:PREDICTED: uncharacterized protein LOC109585472 [Amphimedon queenslandica]|uniref:Uncharacterized protein n=1 Tax=Amphimedon queenslandica TaxID=400682 RepID=A0AAN0JK17_AMPQE|nr:PREDICTED: uncharacterized protein LOC109585472 [Amphimedon queenslandica]|eukprot:XP_019857126.1 PREDICTED: uncharacterized protein LOC109585472 [Amphimedon queenslandica]